MMEDEKLQLLIGLFGELKVGQEELKTELKTDINGVKTDISAVTAGQEELKNDMKSEISAVKNDIETASAL
jgi:hypothetical protein